MSENNIVRTRPLPVTLDGRSKDYVTHGYNLNMAVADIVDNSIAANASEVRVNIELLIDGKIEIFIADNGHGMTDEELSLAMRYGSPERKNKKSLGKFGLGLNTASSSVCRRYTVSSRASVDQEIASLTWDLDHVQEVGDWEVIETNLTADGKGVFEEMCGDVGTLVTWQKCDRVLGRTRPDEGESKVKAALKRSAKNLQDHLNLTFHRYLDKEDDRGANVEIWVNDDLCEGWNPFAPSLSEPNEFQPIEIVKQDDSVSELSITGWLLPHRNDCDKDQKDQVKHSTKGQGFYIYRENRLIQAGGWADIQGWSTIEPHLSLLRVEFDFDYELDEAFEIDVKKSNIIIDPGLGDVVKQLIAPLRREAENRYRKRKRPVLPVRR